MSSVLFTHSYFYRLDSKQWKFKQPYPPLGTITAAAVARNSGFHVSLYDAGLKESIADLSPSIRNHQAKYLVIYDDGFNYLTKMCLTIMREAAFEMSKTAKKMGCIVIVCSSDAADQYEKYFPHGVDYVIRGEGEKTLEELLLTLEKRGDPSMIQGLAFRRQGQTVVTPSRKVMHDLDELPVAAWDLVDIESYRKIWMRHHGYFSLNIATTRGCPFKCNWCAKPIYGNRYNSRSPENVIREIELLITNYKPDHFWMCDDIFGLKPGWVNEFSNLAKEKNLKFKYKIQSRVDLLLEENTIDALSRSGVDTVWVGAESGSQKILDAMDKGTTVEQIREATKLLRQKNIRVAFFLQFGYLGEDIDDIRKTIDMVLELMPDEVGISISYPLPGTKFYEKVKTQLADKQNWRDSDDLDMMFDSTFNTAYYRQLHRYVHSVYRKHKGYSSLKKLFSDPLRLTPGDIRSGLATLYYIPKSFTQQRKLRKLEVVE
jgi:anaerobic magnesium-protoporphyrin IX monomethyl ester cyclase